MYYHLNLYFLLLNIMEYYNFVRLPETMDLIPARIKERYNVKYISLDKCVQV